MEQCLRASTGSGPSSKTLWQSPISGLIPAACARLASSSLTPVLASI